MLLYKNREKNGNETIEKTAPSLCHTPIFSIRNPRVSLSRWWSPIVLVPPWFLRLSIPFQQLSSGLLGWSVRLFGDGESDSPSPEEADLATIFLPVRRALSLVGTHQDKLLNTSLFDPLRLFYKTQTHQQTDSGDDNPPPPNRRRIHTKPI